MRMIGHVIGARATVATRRSVILSADGFELVFVFCGSASSIWSAQKPAPSTPAADWRNDRLPFLVMVIPSSRPYATPARVLRPEALPLPAVIESLASDPHPNSRSASSLRPNRREIEGHLPRTDHFDAFQV